MRVKNAKKLNSCHTCVQKLRKTIFGLKSNTDGMRSFNGSKEIVDSDAKLQNRNMDDLYAINVPSRSANVEHIIPASISRKREYHSLLVCQIMKKIEDHAQIQNFDELLVELNYDVLYFNKVRNAKI